MGKPEFSVVRNKYLFMEGIQKKFLQTEQILEIYGRKHRLFPLVMNIIPKALIISPIPNGYYVVSRERIIVSAVPPGFATIGCSTRSRLNQTFYTHTSGC